MLSKRLSEQQEQQQQEQQQQEEKQEQQEEQQEQKQQPPIQPSAKSCRPQLPELHKICSMEQDASPEPSPSVLPGPRSDTPPHPHSPKQDLEQQEKGPEDDQTSDIVQSSTDSENDFNSMPSDSMGTPANVLSNTGKPMDLPNSSMISVDDEVMQQQNVSDSVTSVIADGTAINDASKQSTQTSSDMAPENERINETKKNNVLAELYTLDDNPDRPIWLNKLINFMEKNGTPISKCPCIARVPIDLFRSYIYVKERGGFEEVSKTSRFETWKEINDLLGFGRSSSAALAHRKYYMDTVFPFECHFDRIGVDPINVKKQMDAKVRENLERACEMIAAGIHPQSTGIDRLIGLPFGNSRHTQNYTRSSPDSSPETQ